MSNSNTMNRITDLPIMNWDTYESGDYKLVLVGVKDVEKNWRRKFYYRNVPDFNKLPNKSTRYCVLLLENKFIPGKYEGEVTYFESDAYSFREINLEKSRIDFFRESVICSGTIDCKFDEWNVDEKFVLPSNVMNGTYEYQELDREKVDACLNAIASQYSLANKCEKLENIVKMHSFVESIFYGRTQKYFPAYERFFLKESSKRVLSMNKILGTDPFERDLKYWTNVLPKYFFSSSEGLKNIHLRDYKNISTLQLASFLISTSASFTELFFQNYVEAMSFLTFASFNCMDYFLRGYQAVKQHEKTQKLCNKPGFIGTTRDFLNDLKNVFVGNKK